MNWNEVSYFKFKRLDEAEKARNGIKGKTRFDLVEVYNPMQYHGFDSFLSHKGQVYINRGNPKEYVSTDGRRLPKIGLTAIIPKIGSVNLTSIYELDKEGYGFGNFNGNETITVKGKELPNPQKQYGFDLLLIIFSTDIVEFIVIPYKLSLNSLFLNRFINDEFDNIIGEMRKSAVKFFDY